MSKYAKVRDCKVAAEVLQHEQRFFRQLQDLLGSGLGIGLTQFCPGLQSVAGLPSAFWPT